MQVFIHEFVVGGGLWSWGSNAPAESFVREGRAMLRAVVEDFAALPGCQVHVLCDERIDGLDSLPARIHAVGSADAERRAVERFAQEADASLLIAPELADALLERTRWVESVGAAERLLSPSSVFVAITSDKNELANRLPAAGVAVPRGRSLGADEPLPQDFSYPAVLKPACGAGSCDVQRVDDAASVVQRTLPGTWRLEELVSGASVSLALLNGPREIVALPAMHQRLGGARGFAYLGGSGPLTAAWQCRAERLARAALAALPATRGYVGMDLVLGSADDGSGDYLIEINPRLTTSYVGLRQLCRSNLAGAMLELAQGRLADLRFEAGSVEFDSDGTVRRRRSAT